LHEFTRRNPSSPFSQLFSRDEQHQQLRELGYSFIQKMVPKEDLTSPIVAAFFKEVFASYALESILSLLCDPDYLNLCIVDVLNDATEGSDENNGTDDDLSHLEGFRSVVEKAAEDAMATKNENVGSIKAAESKPKHRHVEVPPMSVEGEGRKPKTIPKNDDQLVVRTSTSSSTLNEGSPTDGLYPQHSPKSANSEQKWNSNRNSIDSAKTSIRSSTTLQPSSPVMKEQLPMLFERGTASFSIMDISPNDPGEKIDIASLLYFVQIERSASNEKRQSEGGGYILTRTYDNFVTLHSVLSARHPKVVSKLSLKLPLDQGRSWRSSRAQQNNRDAICQSLERYLHTVTDNEILGHDKSVHVFFRKEQSSNEDIDTLHTMSNQPAPEEESVVSKARNYFGGSSTSLNSEDGREAVPSQQMSPRSQYSRWINKKAPRPSSLKDLGENEEPLPRNSASDKLAVTKMTAMEATLVTKVDEQYTGVKDSDGSNTPQDNQKAQNTHKKLNSIEVELLIETTFALITEIFQLTEANQNAWLRRTALNLLREVIRRSYAEVISQQFVKYMEEYARTSYFTTLIGSITEKFWPNGEWATAVAVRTPEEKAATKTLARELLKTRGVPSGARQLIGELNCVDAMERLWSRCQDIDLNRVLGVQLLERTLRPLVN
jgi:Sorting nexin C terminal/PXA domain